MTHTPVTYPVGSHILIENKPITWAVDYVGPQVKLTASVRSGPTGSISPISGQMATSVAIQMDVQVAIELYEKLGELGRSMGWLPQRDDVGQE
jgi:hypothetical protein